MKVEITKNTYKRDLCVHCDTESQAQRVLMALYNWGFEWNGGDPLIKDDLSYDSQYHVNEDQTCYFIEDAEEKTITHASLIFFKGLTKVAKIVSAEDFLQLKMYHKL